VLRRGQAPFFQPQLLEMIVRNMHAWRLSFSTDVAADVRDSAIIFIIAVGTPMGDDGNADLSAVRSVAATIGEALTGPKIVVSKSTVPVETGEIGLGAHR
jgi:UDPglucose 6-dehydrogenase